MAKTPENAYEDEIMTTQPTNDENSQLEKKSVHNIDNIDVAALIEHSLRTTWMLPGGFFVLGIFLVTPETGIFDKQDNVQKLKLVLMQLAE